MVAEHHELANKRVPRVQKCALSHFFQTPLWLSPRASPHHRGSTPLHIAARCGHLEVMKELTKHGVEVNIMDNSGWSPLHEAARNGHLGVTRELIERGAVGEATEDSGWLPLHLAATYFSEAYCSIAARDMNVWWYTLQDRDTDGGLPSFGVTSSGGHELKYDLSC